MTEKKDFFLDKPKYKKKLSTGLFLSSITLRKVEG
jgi:hypothetical protein